MKMVMAKKKSASRAKKKQDKKVNQELIIIDEALGLIFENEETLYAYFEKPIVKLEEEYQQFREADDFSDEEQAELEKYLEETLDQPDQIFKDAGKIEDLVVHNLIKNFEVDGKKFTYIAITYVSSDEQVPTFVLTHFPTRSASLIKKYQKGELVYDQKFDHLQQGAIEGDALLDGDPLALGLFESMTKLRSEKDIPQEKFKDYSDLREETIENADEIWRKTDLDGNILVTFIKEYPDHETKDLYYVAITQEDTQSNVHALLFSFPTTDESLVDRYRQGDNLQAEEISQESSH